MTQTYKQINMMLDERSEESLNINGSINDNFVMRTELIQFFIQDCDL